MTQKEAIQKVSNEILDFLLKFKEKHPDFTFALREKDSNQSKEKRLTNGQWFQGANQIFIAPFARGDATRKIKTFAFVLNFNEQGEITANYMEISFRSLANDETQRNFHEELAQTLGKKLSDKQHAFFHFDQHVDYMQNLKYFFEEVRPIAIELLEKYGLKDTYLYSEKVFQKRLQKIKEIKSQLELKQASQVEEKNITLMQAKTPLNQILFGPPGTGKTHYLLENVIPHFTNKSSSKPQALIESEVVSKLPWWKMIALILIEKQKQTVPQIRNHRFTKYKLAVSDTKSLPQTVWGELSSHTVNDSKTVEYGSRRGALIFDKEEENSIWYIARPNDPVVAELTDLLQNEMKAAPVKEQHNYKFVTFHQSTSYENFVEGITPVFDEENEEGEKQLSYEIQKGSFYSACDEAAKLAGFLGLKDCLDHSKEERKAKFKDAPPYALMIDEINRGNISAIFGELITLIEADKRLTKNEVPLELPYSKKRFGVPPNLYIFGTMNTADRSVEALDTALRRRFSFKEMAPKAELIPDAGKNNGTVIVNEEPVNLIALLTTINARIEVLLDKDHLIGHSYFMKVADAAGLRRAFSNEIIPLLQEYFYGDYGKIALVLGEGFCGKKEKTISFADSSYDSGMYEEKEIYEIHDPLGMGSAEFLEALGKLKITKTDA